MSLVRSPSIRALGLGDTQHWSMPTTADREPQALVARRPPVVVYTDWDLGANKLDIGLAILKLFIRA